MRLNLGQLEYIYKNGRTRGIYKLFWNEDGKHERMIGGIYEDSANPVLPQIIVEKFNGYEELKNDYRSSFNLARDLMKLLTDWEMRITELNMAHSLEPSYTAIIEECGRRMRELPRP